MRFKLLTLLASVSIAGCATPGPREGTSSQPSAAEFPVSVGIIAFNDFHGNLEPPRQSVSAAGSGPERIRVPAGGVAYMASAVARLRSATPNNVVVAAGDLIGASPLASAIFLDEPTILAMNLIGVDLTSVGNHEFDRGRAELLRMQRGGCDKNTLREPCQLDRDFQGARFKFLAANVLTEGGETLFPGTSIKTFGAGRSEVKIAFIGMTLKETDTLVTPAGVAGLSFRDEAETVNALVPRLKAEGADAIVVLIHQGLSTKVPYEDRSCEGIDGDLLPVLARLDPAVDLVVSGHTHNAYICDYGRIDPARPFLVTSAGRYGTMLTDIRLTIDPAAERVVSKSASPVIIQSERYVGPGGAVEPTDLYPRFEREAQVAALVERYVAAAAPLANRVVGRLTGNALREKSESGEQVLGDLIADAHLAATRSAQAGGAQIAFTNGTGVRADIVPGAGGAVTFGQIFAAQPFGNNLVVKSFTGRHIKELLEQQFASGTNTSDSPIMLLPSAGFRYSYDLRKPVGQRIIDPTLNGAPIEDSKTYRVAMNSFLASGGDNFTIFREGTDQVGGLQDIDALEAYLTSASPLAPPVTDRVRNLDPSRPVPSED
jgi:5'-nucleotidase